MQALLDELYAAGQTNDTNEDDRTKKTLNLEPATARCISTLIQFGKRRYILKTCTS